MWWKNEILVYGSRWSPPTRAVLWLCTMQGITHKLEKAYVSGKPSDGENPAVRRLLKINPSGKIPAMEDLMNGVCLFESPAILSYLCAKYDIEHMYPSKKLKRRAKIDEYLSWHHENTRAISRAYVQPLLAGAERRKQLTAPMVAMYEATAKRTLKILEMSHFGKHKFVVDNELSVADLLCYEEVSQLAAWKLGLGPDIANDYPNISGWLQTMSRIKGHTKVHRVYKRMAAIIAEEKGKLELEQMERKRLKLASKL